MLKVGDNVEITMLRHANRYVSGVVLKTNGTIALVKIGCVVGTFNVEDLQIIDYPFAEGQYDYLR